MLDIEKMCEDNSDIVYKYLVCLTHDKELSEDLLQDTFYYAIKNLKKFRYECSETAWLCKIAKNLCYQEYNKRKKLHLTNDDSIFMYEVSHNEDIDDLIIENNEKKILYDAINKLDEDLRNIISLRITGELSFKEIGSILNNTEVWARVNFYRGKEKLKKILRKENLK